MHRFYVPPSQCQGPSLTLSGREAHHGTHVLRLRRGEKVVVLDGAGRQLSCEVAEVGRDRLRLEVQATELIPANPWRITLLQAIPKGKVFDAIVQKAAELGTFKVVPVLTERVVAQVDEDRAERKVEHWQTTAIEAIKQCGSAWLTRVESPGTLAQALQRQGPVDLCLVASLQNDSLHPSCYFVGGEPKGGEVPRDVREADAPKTVAVWVGPEGDFTPGELQELQNAGARPITLGRWTLRSETAAIYCLSVLNYELQRLHRAAR